MREKPQEVLHVTIAGAWLFSVPDSETVAALRARRSIGGRSEGWVLVNMIAGQHEESELPALKEQFRRMHRLEGRHVIALGLGDHVLVMPWEAIPDKARAKGARVQKDTEEDE